MLVLQFNLLYLFSVSIVSAIYWSSRGFKKGDNTALQTHEKVALGMTQRNLICQCKFQLDSVSSPCPRFFVLKIAGSKYNFWLLLSYPIFVTCEGLMCVITWLWKAVVQKFSLTLGFSAVLTTQHIEICCNRGYLLSAVDVPATIRAYSSSRICVLCNWYKARHVRFRPSACTYEAFPTAW